MESAAALPWNQWQLSCGIGGRLAMELVAAFVWNRWQLCRGISGRIHLESVAALPWNTQRMQHYGTESALSGFLILSLETSGICRSMACSLTLTKAARLCWHGRCKACSCIRRKV